MRELNLLDFVHKPDINQMLRDGVLKEDDIKVKECVTDIDAYHYFYDSPRPVGPKDNEIWYWGEYYDLENAINILSQQGIPYVGPSILSNEQVGDKYIITFDGPVTKLGLDTESVELYPIFFNEPDDMGVECNITSIEIPNIITSIGGSAFYNCSSLTSVTIPNRVASIEQGAFASCVKLTKIEIPSGVTIIGYQAFVSCTGLTSVSIGNSVTSIGGDAFMGCSSLTSVVIPNSVTNIEFGAFDECSGLTSITCEAITPPTCGSDVFSDTNNCPIYVPAESVDAYKAAENWSTYADRIQAIR